MFPILEELCIGRWQRERGGNASIVLAEFHAPQT